MSCLQQKLRRDRFCAAVTFAIFTGIGMSEIFLKLWRNGMSVFLSSLTVVVIFAAIAATYYYFERDNHDDDDFDKWSNNQW